MKLLMKKLIVAVLTLIAIVGCEKNLDEDNSPAIQAVRNGEFFKAQDMAASIDIDGRLIIQGTNQLESLTISLDDSSPGTYILGQGASSEATYVFNNSQSFSSNANDGRGEVTITSSSNSGFVSGTFDFVTYTANAADSLYMRKGVIFEVPLGGTINPGNGNTTNSFAADVDGQALNPSLISPNVSSGTILIFASNQNISLSISFPDTIVPGVYSFPTDATGLYAQGTSGETAQSGTIEILTHDTANNSITGTFNYTTTGGIVIDNGSFDVQY
ncbi:hypothetical protein BST93_04560 [Nonlabens tegetincola]|nr:hypothetical protein BST93_04560 [Nonlabens tegetincola]